MAKKHTGGSSVGELSADLNLQSVELDSPQSSLMTPTINPTADINTENIVLETGVLIEPQVGENTFNPTVDLIFETISLESSISSGPHLMTSELDSKIITGAVDDVRINNQSIVYKRIANINLGDTLRFNMGTKTLDTKFTITDVTIDY